MAKVSVLNVAVLENPSPFHSPFRFEISFECNEALADGEAGPVWIPPPTPFPGPTRLPRRGSRPRNTPPTLISPLPPRQPQPPRGDFLPPPPHGQPDPLPTVTPVSPSGDLIIPSLPFLPVELLGFLCRDLICRHSLTCGHPQPPHLPCSKRPPTYFCVENSIFVPPTQSSPTHPLFSVVRYSCLTFSLWRRQPPASHFLFIRKS